ncbi:cytochrome b2 [Planoprotostelium fungivorum]|uniref:L-lactate dehydrogenase (cytochrome) n=1 Tax=Planoprotostelium fungivorum TaxID=1890364 RepID=A0A2P6NSW4_9EUKA|nr:cytochrome b2 [Planoprotostelium fungivorum]
MKAPIKRDEVAKHKEKNDCWVYDVTHFLDEHPGGAGTILAYAGKDATAGFQPIHNTDVLDLLPENCLLGQAEEGGKEETKAKPEDHKTAQKEADKQQLPESPGGKPPLDQMLNLMDFESVARDVMKKEGWGYYSSGGDDEITLRENHLAFQRIWLRPRVMVDVSKIDMRTTMMGSESSLPLYITATALGRLADPEGEVVLTRAAYSEGIIQMCPTLASNSLEEMIKARKPGQTQWYQLYVNKNRQLTEKIVKKAEDGGMKALFVTVDAPALGRREKDMRNKFAASAPDVQKGQVNRQQGTARAISTFIDPSLSWKDMQWLKTMTKMPIVLKGIQTGEDALLAYKYGAKAIVVSNHGGRQLDTARSGIEALAEVVEALKEVDREGKMEIYVDGGIRRGSDIFKAIALGAKGVGIGRPMLYSLAAYGQPGVERAIQLLKDELEMVMRLMGTPTIADIKREMIDTKSLSLHFVPAPRDHLTESIYEPMRAAKL